MSDLSRPYALDSANECERLEAQARLAGIAAHLKYLPPLAGKRVLDAGCGSGSMARLIAGRNPDAAVTGLDFRQAYVEFATAKAAGEGLGNVVFRQGDIFALPFADATFDVAWTKYLLQWLKDPKPALAELKRVLRPGGLLISCDFVGFAIEHFPVEPEFERLARAAFPALVDVDVGRKVAAHLIALGFADVTVDMEADRLFTTVGRIDPERRLNWEMQWTAARAAFARALGSQAAADALRERFFAHYDDPATCSLTTLYFTRGRRSA